MPFDPLVSLVGYVFLRSADSRDYAGESGAEVRDHVNRFQAAAYRSFKTIAVHDSVFRGEGFYPMAFLAPRFYRLPSWMGYDESLQASWSIGDREVLILWRMVARVPPTGATPNVAVARPGGRAEGAQERLPFDPARAW